MREFTRSEIAAAKRTLKNAASIQRRIDKAQEQLDKAQAKIAEEQPKLDLILSPMIIISGGYTPEQIAEEKQEAPKYLVENHTIVGINPEWENPVELNIDLDLEEEVEEEDFGESQF